MTLQTRMALHTGAVEGRDNDYFGPSLNRIARLLAAGHGGQILISTVTQELIRDALPPTCALLNLGEHRLRDLNRPEQIFQLLHPALLLQSVAHALRVREEPGASLLQTLTAALKPKELLLILDNTDGRSWGCKLWQ